MIKRILCVLICALLALPAALAEDTATLDIASLIARQVSANSTFRVQLTLEASEQAPFFADEKSWAALKALLPGLSLEGAYVLSRAGETLGNSQLTLQLKRGEGVLSTLRLSGRGDEWQVWGDALEDTVLLMSRDTGLLLRDKYVTLAGWAGVLLRDAGLLESLLRAEGEGDWPGLRRSLLESGTADAAWRGAAEAALEKYTHHLSGWMQAHTALRVQRDGEGVYTESELRVDMAECAREAAALLRMFYQDGELLDLLRQRMTEREAAAYLEDGMLPLFEEALQGMSAAAEMVLLRRYAADGTLQRLSLTLPLADGSCLFYERQGEESALRLARQEEEAALSWQGSREKGWQGAFSYNKGETRVSGRYELFSALEPVVMDEGEGGRVRRQNGAVTLAVTPDEGQAFPAQTLTAEISATAGAMDTQAARWNILLHWQEAGGAFLRAAVKTRTGAAIQQTEAEGEALILAEAGESLRQAVVQQALAHWLAALAPVAD